WKNTLEDATGDTHVPGSIDADVTGASDTRVTGPVTKMGSACDKTYNSPVTPVSHSLVNTNLLIKTVPKKTGSDPGSPFLKRDTHPQVAGESSGNPNEPPVTPASMGARRTVADILKLLPKDRAHALYARYDGHYGLPEAESELAAWQAEQGAQG